MRRHPAKPMQPLTDDQKWRIWSRAIDYALTLPVTKKMTPSTGEALAGSAVDGANVQPLEAEHEQVYTKQQQKQ